MSTKDRSSIEQSRKLLLRATLRSCVATVLILCGFTSSVYSQRIAETLSPTPASIPDSLLAGLDTLSHVDLSGYRYWIRHVDVVLQAERFDLASPSLLRAFSVTLVGSNDTGSATIHLFGRSGGAPVPRWEDRVATTRVIHKTRRGIETIRVSLDTPIYLAPGQMFVGVSDLSPHTALGRVDNHLDDMMYFLTKMSCQAIVIL